MSEYIIQFLSSWSASAMTSEEYIVTLFPLQVHFTHYVENWHKALWSISSIPSLELTSFIVVFRCSQSPENYSSQSTKDIYDELRWGVSDLCNLLIICSMLNVMGLAPDAWCNKTLSWLQATSSFWLTWQCDYWILIRKRDSILK